MPQNENPATIEKSKLEQAGKLAKRTTFSVDPLAPLVVEENITDDAWRQSQVEDPERWDGLS